MLELLKSAPQILVFLKYAAIFLGGGGIIWKALSMWKARNEALKQEGRNEVSNKVTEQKLEGMKDAKKINDEIDKLDLDVIDFYNAYGQWPSVAAVGEFKRTGVWPVPAKAG